jgi:hypothetical protein
VITMAKTGPAPKVVKHGHGGGEWQDVPDAPYTGPGSDRDLPEIPGLPWYPQTVAWWEVVRTMPHCRLWTASDWLWAIDTAILRNQCFGELFGGALPVNLVSEMRQRENIMGVSMEARRKLGIRYVDPAQFPEEFPQGAPAENSAAPQPGGNVKDITKAPSRRARLAG